jgi:hypothetical protein
MKTKSRIVKGWRHAAPHATAAPTRRSEPVSRNSEFVTRMEKQMTRWDKEVEALVKLGAMAKENAQARYLEGVKDLHASRDAAQKTFQEMRFASEETGAQLRAGMQDAWVAMQAALEKVTTDLKK